MARFRATIEGQNGGMASRIGSAKSGTRARVNGWAVGVDVEAHADGEADVLTIYATRGSSPAGGHGEEIGTVRLVDGAPRFIPASHEALCPSRHSGECLCPRAGVEV